MPVYIVGFGMLQKLQKLTLKKRDEVTDTLRHMHVHTLVTMNKLFYNFTKLSSNSLLFDSKINEFDDCLVTIRNL